MGFGGGGQAVTVASSLPAAAANYVGRIYLIPGTGGTPSRSYICVETSTGGYEWDQLTVSN